MNTSQAYLLKLLRFVQIWYFSAAEDVTDVFKERFFQRLGVVEQEYCRFVVHTSEVIQAL